MEITVIKVLRNAARIDTQNLDLFGRRSAFTFLILKQCTLLSLVLIGAARAVSKLTLDAVIMIDGNHEKPTHHHLPNTPDEIQKLFKIFTKIPNFSLDKCLICVEATGTHSRAFILILFLVLWHKIKQIFG